MSEEPSQVTYEADFSKVCHECALKGRLNYIKVFQTSDNQAVCVCDCVKDPCNTEPVVLNRKHNEMPVNEDFLLQVSLPSSLAQEKNLKLCHIEDLIWLNSIKPTIHDIIEGEKEFIEYCQKLELLGIKGSQYVLDPDIARLKQLDEEMIRFGKHIIADLEDIVNEAKKIPNLLKENQ